MYKRLLNIPHTSQHSYFILGPRGTGKTYWITQQFPDAIYIDLLESTAYREFQANPALLARRIPDHFSGWVVIDEIQKNPELLNEVHRLIEHRKIRFILTGSSARGLRRKGVNLLAGRALSKHMHPLTCLELQNDFNLEHALHWGQLPAVIRHEDPKNYLTSYIQTYLREEVLQEGLTRNLGLFSHFLEIASFSQGEVVNYTNIAREVSSNRHTVNNFFDILEDLLIAYRLPVFSKKAKRDLITHPKFYYFDTGIFNILRPKGPLDSTQEIQGAALETLFLQQARALNDYFDLGYHFYYWRTRSQLEVDFILYGEKGFHAFEIKRSNNLTPHDFKALHAFLQDYPQTKAYVFYGGDKEYWEGNIHVYPFSQGLFKLFDILNAIDNKQ